MPVVLYLLINNGIEINDAMYNTHHTRNIIVFSLHQLSQCVNRDFVAGLKFFFLYFAPHRNRSTKTYNNSVIGSCSSMHIAYAKFCLRYMHTRQHTLRFIKIIREFGVQVTLHLYEEIILTRQMCLYCTFEL